MYSGGSPNVYEAISKHPKYCALVLAALVVLLVIALIYLYSASKAAKTTFLSNTTTGNNNPEWYFGSQHAGMGGTIDTPLTPLQLSIYQPKLRASPRALSQFPHGSTTRCSMQGRREGLDANGNIPNWANAGNGVYSYSGPDPAPDIGYLNNSNCADNINDWNPAATAEAQALASAGALAHASNGELLLQQAINQAQDATDPSSGLDQDQLAFLARSGGAP